MAGRGGSDKSRSKEVDLETLLREIDTHADDFEVDFELEGGVSSGSGYTPVDFSVAKDLVPHEETGGRQRVAPGRELALLSETEFLDSRTLDKKRIIHPGMADYSIMNDFREIRTILLQKSENKNFVLIVVSIDTGMGATFTAVNLGAAFAYEGERTALLIDCYPKKGNLGDLLDLGNKSGLTDYLDDTEMDAADIIYPTGISRLRLIPYGNNREAGLKHLTTERMKEFIGALKRRHKDRFLFINSPPLESSADAAILAEVADFVLVVVPYGKVSKSRLERAMRFLPPEKIAGIVMNDYKQYV